ncbi:AMP-binding protein [candidate division WWE3 bacterium]|nr:AMP-binding protein [candidate division WWE3 bacterium]
MALIERVFDDFETKYFGLFYLLCRYRFYSWKTKDIQFYQKRKTQKIVEYASAHSSFFKKHYANYNKNDFAHLPTVNKKIMMDNLTEYNTLGLTKDEIINFCLDIEKTRDYSRRLNNINIGMSSGTSGNKGVEILTHSEESYLKAAFFARFNFPKNQKINLAFILRVSTPAFNLNMFGHKLTYITQLQPMQDIVRQLNDLKPNLVSAPPSMLKLLAQEQEQNRLKIKPLKLVSYAEVLYQDVREYLTKIFNCSVNEIYKCTEGAIAISCKHDNLHINEDLVLVETLNQDGSPTPLGQPCHKLLVTDLHKRSQPIIRYELNDIITICKTPCTCGSSFRVIERIQGRSDDMFWGHTIGSESWQFIFPDYISRAIISSSEDIEEYQAIQKSPTEIYVRIQLRSRIAPTSFDQQKLKNAIMNVFTEYKCQQPHVDIAFEKPEVNTRSQKLIRIKREFDAGN